MIEIDSPTPTPGSRSGGPFHSVDRVVVLVRAGLVAVFLPDAGARHEALGHLLVLPSHKRTQTSRHGSVSHLPVAPTPVLSLLGPARPAAPHHLPPTTRARYIMRPACWRPPQPCTVRAARPGTGQRGGLQGERGELGTQAALLHNSCVRDTGSAPDHTRHAGLRTHTLAPAACLAEATPASAASSGEIIV